MVDLPFLQGAISGLPVLMATLPLQKFARSTLCANSVGDRPQTENDVIGNLSVLVCLDATRNYFPLLHQVSLYVLNPPIRDGLTVCARNGRNRDRATSRWIFLQNGC